MWGELTETDEGTVLTTTMKKTLSTSGENLFVGEEGDVYVGAGYNFIFSEVGVVGVEGCEVSRTTSVGFQPDTVFTTYAYSGQYISDVLIPELDTLSSYYAGLAGGDDTSAEMDSSIIFSLEAGQWRSILAENDTLKARAQFAENRSFSAGADFSYEFQSDSTRWYQRTVTATFDWDVKLPVIGFDSDYFAIHLSGQLKHHNEALGDHTDHDSTWTETVGYTLSDGDIGDHFSVDVKYDPIYPSPVFDVLAGVSSCPYEPWPAPLDTTELARMVPRDKPRIIVEPHVVDAVPPDEAAVFTLQLNNLSPNFEPRRVVLRVLNAANKYGAVIKVGDYPIANGLEYYIEPFDPQVVTLTVERGPNRYQYKDLALFVYPPCEYELWEEDGFLAIADTAWFSVTFDAPCSDVTLVSPEPGWVYNTANAGAPISLHLKDYELDIGDDGGSLLRVGMQYRRLGSGNEGPSAWTSCVECVVEGPDSAGTFIDWTPPEALEDGVYELRVYTECDGGTGYSEVSTGTIERNSPVAFGAPEPADGELSLGEAISVTFNEAIDCRSVLPANVALAFVDGPAPGATISHETGCDGKTIVITPTVSANLLEGRRIEASVTGVADKAGNAMVDTLRWEFEFRKSRFTWSRLYVAADISYRNPGSVTADLVNGTGEPVEYSIEDWPEWIVSVTPADGTIPPGGTQSVDFALRDTTMGVYEWEVTAADTALGVAALFDLSVTVACHDPAWVIDPGRFEHTMTMVTALEIDGAVTNDTGDKVAAFVGNQLRGVADVMHVAAGDQYLAYLTVYSNRMQDEMVRFQVWDESECRLYNATLENHPFVANTSIGSTSVPDTLTATDIEGGGALTIAVNSGWNWISTNVASPDMSVNSVFSNLVPADGDLVKSHEAFSQAVFLYNDTTGTGWTWEGTLVDLDIVSSYMVRLSSPGAIMHTGSPAPIATPVPVQQGWNWIGYLPRGPEDVTDALIGLHNGGLAAAGDVIKSQTGFAEYVGGVWYGSLDSLRTGRGYKLSLSSAVNSSFVYPAYVPMAAPPLAVAAADAIAALLVEGAPDWRVDPYAFQYNMTMTAVLTIDGRETIDERDILGAFVGDECRGVARPLYVEGVKRYVAFLMIYSNAAAGETVKFRAFDADAGIVYDVRETLACNADAVAGTVGDPRVLSVIGLLSEESSMPTVFGLGQNRPNPFNPTTVIGYDVPPGGGHVSIRIYDVAGRLVRTLVDGVETPGRKSVTWDGQSNGGQMVSTGVYFYRMTAPGFEQNRKMVIMK